MFTYFHNVDAYVEAQPAYKADRVKLSLDEGTFRVTVYPVDTDGVNIVGAAPIVDKTLTDLDKASEYYQGIAQQLAQGDVIRNV